MRVETATPPATLIGALWPNADARTLVRFAVLAVIGAALLTISAKIKVPFYPVPMTLADARRRGHRRIVRREARGRLGDPVPSGRHGGTCPFSPTPRPPLRASPT